MTSLIDSEELRHVPILISANKQDLPGALSPRDIADIMGVEQLQKFRRVHVQAMSATSGEGLYEGMQWLSDVVHKKKEVATEATEIPRECDSTILNQKDEGTEKTEAEKMEALITEWLSREDEPDDEFLHKLDSYTLEVSCVVTDSFVL